MYKAICVCLENLYRYRNVTIECMNIIGRYVLLLLQMYISVFAEKRTYVMKTNFHLLDQ